MRVVLKRWQLGSFSSTIFFLEDQKEKGIPRTASGAAQRLVCLRTSAGRIRKLTRRMARSLSKSTWRFIEGEIGTQNRQPMRRSEIAASGLIRRKCHGHLYFLLKWCRPLLHNARY